MVAMTHNTNRLSYTSLVSIFDHRELNHLRICVECVRRLVPTSWPFTDDSMCAVLAGSRLPEPCVTLHPEAAVSREHAKITILLLPVSELHH